MARNYGRRRNFGPRPVINSIKNSMGANLGLTTSVQTVDLAKAVSNPVNTVTTDTRHGCLIKAIWITIDFCGLAGSGVLQRTHAYLIKNVGANLSPPSAFSIGSSNEKKFIIKEWTSMTMRNQDGNPPYHWEGWVKIPKRYHRMGTDDLWQLAANCDNSTGHLSVQAIYKWYT